MSGLRLLGFVVVVFGLSIGLHLYVGSRLAAPFQLSAGAQRVVYALLIVHAVAMPAIFLTIPATGTWWADTFQHVGYIGMGLFSLVAVLLLARDGAVALLTLLAKTPAADVVDPARRAFLGQAGSLAVLGFAALLGGAGWVQARREAVVERVRVAIDGLPEALEGLRIAQISDLHAGPTVQADAFAGIVAQVNALNPDLVAVTGDMVDGSVAGLAGHVAPLANLRSRHGTFFVTGNHEYYSGADAWCAHCRGALGMTVLHNEHVVLDHDGAALAVAGVTDQRAGGMAEGHASDPAAAVAGIPDGAVRVLLAHQPTSAFAAKDLGVHLQLSGHTHAGQYFPFTWLVQLVLPFARGLHRAGSMWVYVNRGTTFWGPPLRLGAEQEITLLELHRA